jgi:HPt (histidine-containing phosphotransfer) domain-containing protein
MATDTRRDPAALERLRELGGEPLVQKLIDLFLENTPKRIQTAIEGERSGAWREVERAAHSIKSSLANLGFEGVRALALELEEAAERKDAETVGPLLGELQAVLPVVLGALQDLRPPPAIPGNP